MKALQMSVVAFTGSVGLISGMLLGKIRSHFKNCFLYGNVSVELQVKEETQTVVVKPGSEWGPETTCNFITFEGVLVFMNSFIWLWFYIHMENITR